MIDIEELKKEYISKAVHKVCWNPQEVFNPHRGGQTVSLSPTGVWLESEETGFGIFINSQRSQIKNLDLALTFFRLYLDKTIK